MALKSFLIDGPLMTTIERRKAVTERMARDLVQNGESLSCDRDAVRVLVTDHEFHEPLLFLRSAYCPSPPCFV